jgi:hypothetical protein
MKYLILAAVLFVVITYSMRKRREAEAREARREGDERSSMYSTEDGAVNVRSADNVRLISDDQLDAMERGNKRE